MYFIYAYQPVIVLLYNSACLVMFELLKKVYFSRCEGNTCTTQDAYMPTFDSIKESGASIPLTRTRDVALLWAMAACGIF